MFGVTVISADDTHGSIFLSRTFAEKRGTTSFPRRRVQNASFPRRQRERQRDRQTNGYTDRGTDRHTNGQMDRLNMIRYMEVNTGSLHFNSVWKIE